MMLENLTERERQIAEEAWDEAARIDEGCHDCIAICGYTNPYRATVHTNRSQA